MIIGCRITFRHWKSATLSTFKEWIEVLSSMASYEGVISTVAGKEDLFYELCGPFLAAGYEILTLPSSADILFGPGTAYV